MAYGSVVWLYEQCSFAFYVICAVYGYIIHVIPLLLFTICTLNTWFLVIPGFIETCFYKNGKLGKVIACRNHVCIYFLK